jgi:ABC-type glycerol-3-phosphate transport system permease component
MRKSPAHPAKRHVHESVVHLVLIAATILSIFPLLWIAATSLKTKQQYLANKIGPSWPLTFSSIQNALSSANFLKWILNSFFITGSAIVLGTVTAVFAAYAITKLSFRGRDLLLNYSIALMAIPVIVMVTPLYILFSRLHMVNTYFGMILVYSGITAPFSVYLLVSFFKSIPWEIVESSIIDGCNSFDVLIRIIVPISGPPLATLLIVNALWIWNELLLALIFLPMDKTHTIMVGLTVHQSRYSVNVPVVVSGLLISALPMLVMYLALQRFFIRGLVEGSIKG